MLELAGLKEEDRKESKHIITSLKGKVKGERMEKNHQFSCVKMQSSELNVDF